MRLYCHPIGCRSLTGCRSSRWILEIWPVKHRTQDRNGDWIKKIGANLGRRRAIRDERPNLHYSVLIRQQEYAVVHRWCHSEESVASDAYNSLAVRRLGYKLQNEVDVDAEYVQLPVSDPCGRRT